MSDKVPRVQSHAFQAISNILDFLDEELDQVVFQNIYKLIFWNL